MNPKFRQKFKVVFSFNRRLTLAVFLLHCSLIARDKQAQIDSLNQVIQTTTSDTVLVNTYFELDNLIYLSDPLLDEQINRTVRKICSDHLAKPETLSKGELHFYKREHGAAL